MGSRSLHCRLLPPAKTDSPEPLRVSGLCVLQLRNGTIGLSDEADADQADCPMRYDSHTLVESRQCVPGLAGFRLLGARHTVSDVHRHQHLVALVLQSLAPVALRHLRAYPQTVPVQRTNHDLRHPHAGQ